MSIHLAVDAAVHEPLRSRYMMANAWYQSLRNGRLDEAWQAFERLRETYPSPWFDDVSYLDRNVAANCAILAASIQNAVIQRAMFQSPTSGAH